MSNNSYGSKSLRECQQEWIQQKHIQSDGIVDLEFDALQLYQGASQTKATTVVAGSPQ